MDPYGATGFSVNLTDMFSLQGGLMLQEGKFYASTGASIDLPSLSFVVGLILDGLTQDDFLARMSFQLKINLGDEGRYDKARKVDALYLEGLEYYASGDYEAAISFYEQALALDPSFRPAERAREAALREIEVGTRSKKYDPSEIDRGVPVGAIHCNPLSNLPSIRALS